MTISYPLHPPGRPDRLRVDHLPDVAVPVAVRPRHDGIRSGRPDELQQWTATIAGAGDPQWLDGGHDLKGKDAAVARVVADWVRTL